MKCAAATRLVGISLKSRLRSVAASSFGIAVGVAVLIFFVALSLGVGRTLRTKVFPVEAGHIEVIPKMGFALFPAKLDEASVGRLKALPGVVRAYRKMAIRAPAASTYDGEFFGRPLRMAIEVIAMGVEPDYVKADVSAEAFQDRGSDAPIPSLIASRLLTIYNVSFAPSRNLPRLSPAMLEGFGFPVDVNRSITGANVSGQVLHARAQIAGVSERAILAGLTIPLDVARRLNQSLGLDAKTYSAVTLALDGPARVPATIAKVRSMGFEVDEEGRKLADGIGAAVAVATLAFAVLSILIAILAAFNVSRGLSAMVVAREREFAVFRAIGATRLDIMVLVLAEAFVVGLVGVAVGGAVALAAIHGADGLARTLLPPLPIKLESFFAAPLWLWCAAPGGGILAAVLGALGAALRASRVNPIRALGAP